MKVKPLLKALRNVAKFSNPYSTIPQFRYVEISTRSGCTFLKTQSETGGMEEFVEEDIEINETFYMHPQLLIQLLRSFTSSTDIKFSIEGEALKWETDNTRGKLLRANLN